MGLVFGIKVTFENTSHKLTSPTFIEVLYNIYMTISTRQNAERAEKLQLGKQKKGKLSYRRERMERCKCKTGMNKDVQVLMNEDKKEIIFQEKQFLITV